MIRIRQVKIPIDKDNIDNIKKEISKILKINIKDIKNLTINKKSIDARYKPDIFYIYEVDIDTNKNSYILKHNKNSNVLEAPKEQYKFNITGASILNTRPVIIGAGPSGLFCAYMLSMYGYKPIIIERGEKIEDRVNTVESFWNNNKLNTESNVQFGEGGAGTFSDGKLVTQIKDKEHRGKLVMNIFVDNGAPEEIKYLNKAHIGTDLLRNIIINMRNKIISMGGEFHYNTKLTNVNIKDNKVDSIELNNELILQTELLILAIGHSARDTFELLYNNNIPIEPKPFAIGIRIQHHQKLINKNQYGIEYNEKLGSANYKLTHRSKNGRGAYTFCMCPGGYVVNSSSEHNRLCINGMSNHKRDTDNANSAIIVTVSPDDYGTNPLDGIKFQRDLEEKAYNIGKGLIPTQTYKDYKNNIESTNLGTIKPIFKGSYTLTNLNKIFPDYINESLKETIEAFDKKIPGYANDDVLLSAVESRTSSPIRIIRDNNCESSIKGLYPCGEGAGYAGGITSASIDGIKIAESIASFYKPFTKGE